jgi:hypothetical protein
MKELVLVGLMFLIPLALAIPEDFNKNVKLTVIGLIFDKKLNRFFYES